MKLFSTKTLPLVPAWLFTHFYSNGVFIFATEDRSVEAHEVRELVQEVVALFVAGGPTGDSALKVALDDPDIRKIHLMPCSSSTRIEEGIASGKVQMTLMSRVSRINFAKLIRSITRRYRVCRC